MEYFKSIDRYMKEMSAEELKMAFPDDTQNSYLMRSILMNEMEFSTVTYDRTLRNFWYKVVKPILDKLGLLFEKDLTEEGLTKWDMELSRYMADLVRRGFLTYKDLHIDDQSRQRETPYNRYDVVDLKTFGYQVGVSAYPNIILTTEKDTVFSILRDMASLFGCSCISGKGQNSLGAMESLLRKITWRLNNRDIYILTITDYDPSGYYIADTFKNQVEDLKAALNITVPVHIERIGITPDQLTPEEVSQNMYTPKPANLDKWFAITGGINGEPKGLELDALEPDQIREIFVACIKKYIDPDVYEKIVKSAYVRWKALEALKPRFERALAEIVEDVESRIAMRRDFMEELALKGYNQLPISKLCDSNMDDVITAKALSYFRE